MCIENLEQEEADSTDHEMDNIEELTKKCIVRIKLKK